MKLFPQKERVRELPILPTQHTLIFPGHASTLFVTQDSAKAAIAAATTEGGRSFLAVPQKELTPIPKPDDLYRVGTLVWILHNIRLPDGSLRIIVDGRDRAMVAGITEKEGVLYGAYRQISANKRDPDNELPKLARLIRDSFEEYAKLSPTLKSEARKKISEAESPDQLVNAIGTHVAFDMDTRVAIFKEASSLARARLTVDSLDGEVELLGLKRSIRDRVRKRMEQHQKDHFLNEQIREINKELGKGDDDDDGHAELLQRIDEAELPEDVATQAQKELRRLKKLPSMAPESGIIRTYIEWLLDLPWNAPPREAADIKQARQILDEDHYDMEKPKERLLEYMAVQSLNPDLKAPILCFVGPPGTGKTSLGKSMARALDRAFVRLSLGGVRDEAEIRGHRRTYVGAMPGRIIQAMKRAGTHDPVMLLDEVDKLGADFRGDPASALLEVLDPEQNNSFSDHYIEVPFDLSRVVFLTTANSLHGIPAALRDRLEIIEIPGYTEREKQRIALDFLVPEQLRENGLETASIKFRRDAVLRLIHEYTSESGVRNLKREIANVIRKLARELMEQGTTVTEYRRTIGAPTVSKLLGPPRFHHDEGDREIRVPGVVQGLAWTENGGVVLPVEVVILPGSGDLQLTGSLGDVMKESARAALSHILAHSAELGVAFDRTTTSIHIHVPQGAIPKDGPSAGITMFSALLSALSGRVIRSDTAMTGEITLSGRVLAIGGLKEKMLAARRRGISRVILPEGNRNDLEALPQDVRTGIECVLLKTVDALPEHLF
ncbi:MAG: endopeptidase La [Spirochaeta sp.]|jgi:ATP-dependent Lon protease|nr:endopeptidase La [Spirochaeta sp.]